MGWASRVLTTSTFSAALSIVACLGSEPSYNVPLALLGLVVPTLNHPFLATALSALVPLTLLMDIVWCALYGPYLSGGAALFGLM
jgi:hypothetical protein